MTFLHKITQKKRNEIRYAFMSCVCWLRFTKLRKVNHQCRFIPPVSLLAIHLIIQVNKDTSGTLEIILLFH